MQRVSDYLLRAGAEARIEEFSTPTLSAADAAEAVGCALRQIVKSLVLECDGRPVLALVPGDRRADATKVARAAQAHEARIASAPRVREITGFDPGAVAPFPQPRIDRTFLDRTLLTNDRVWVGGGSPSHLIGLAPAELQRLARATPLDIVSEDPAPLP